MLDDPDLQADSTARVGTVLCGKYRLDSVLGIGGMATVYAATHRNQAQLAIKILHGYLAAEPTVRARFLREAYATNSVQHRSVVRVVDDDVAEDGSVFLVMERLTGVSLDDVRDRAGGSVPLEAAVCIVEQLLDVLAAAHAQGIVHRDVKPANLLVTPEGEVKVLDFGIARIRESMASGQALTGASSIIGTPTYMAPEQALPGMAEIDERTDVWAAGATLFALLSGHTVHEADTQGEVLVKAALEPARSLAAVAPRTPQAIVEAVDGALAFEKARRWGSARDMRTALLAAYRLHFGRAPRRESVAALLVTSERTIRMHRIALEQSAIVPAVPREPFHDTARVGDDATLRSRTSRTRTSIPVAADKEPDAPPPRSRPRAGWTIAALVAALPLALVALRWGTTREPARAAAAADEAAEVATLSTVDLAAPELSGPVADAGPDAGDGEGGAR